MLSDVSVRSIEVFVRAVIGAGAIVGAGALVMRDMEPGAVVVGNPAREVSRNPLVDRELRCPHSSTR